MQMFPDITESVCTDQHQGHCWYRHLVGALLQRSSTTRRRSISENVVFISIYVQTASADLFSYPQKKY